MIIQSDQLVKDPLVSVVIATYNQVNFIEQTVMSALKQQCDFPFEVIVGDDGSDDGNRDVLLRIQKEHPERVKLVFNDDNLWVTKNYISTIKEARAPYIATLDGDDIWVDCNKIQKQKDIIESDPTVSMVHTGFRSFNSETGETVAIVQKWESPLTTQNGKESVGHFLRHDFSSYPFGSSCFFRKNQYLSLLPRLDSLINDKGSTGEGTLLNVIMCMSGRYVFIPEVMVDYRILTSSLSHTTDKYMSIDFILRYTNHRIIAAQCLELSDAIINDILSAGLMQALERSVRHCCYGYFIDRLKTSTFSVSNSESCHIVKHYCSKVFVVKVLLMMLKRKIYAH